MKKIIITLTITLNTLHAYSQMTVRDSANNADIALYAGTLGGSRVLIKDGSVANFYTLRLGGTVMWKPLQNFSFYGLGAGEVDHTGKVNSFSLFGITLTYKSLKLVSGKIATPMTELRPLPTTGAGQFEPWTRQQIPGSALGAKISFASKKFSGVLGAFKRGTDCSLEGGWKTSKTQTAGYYMAGSKEFGIASNVVLKNLTTTVFANNKKVAGMFNLVTIPRLKLFVYSDIGYDFEYNGLVRGEWGVFKTFKARSINALLAIGYDHKGRAIKNYIFVYL